MQEAPTDLETEVAGLGMFVGEYPRSLDGKKRVTIPSVWRAMIGNPRSLYVLPDFNETCLKVLPAREMALKLERLRQSPMGDKAANEAQRQLGRVSDVLTWDGQGRIRISDRLLEFAGIGTQVVLVGALGSFEVWSPESRAVEEAIDPAGLQEALRNIGI